MKHVDPYLSATELRITEDERSRLIGVSRTILTDSKPFYMGAWSMCIRGRMYPRSTGFLGVMSRLFHPHHQSPSLNGLFGAGGSCWEGVSSPIGEGVFSPIYASREQAASAIHHFLVTGS